MRFITRLLGMALVLILLSQFIPGITIVGTGTAVVAALVLGFLNAVVRPVLVFFTLPITVLTLGLFLLVINASVFMLAAWLVPGFVVDNFVAALVGATLVALAGFILNRWV